MRLLVFQHIACEHPGRLRRFLAKDGISWDAVELDEGDLIPDLHDYDALWVMGGPMDVWETDDHPWLVAEKDAIRHWAVDLEKPFLGICLGHQLLAEALGGRCAPMTTPEIGILEIELTSAGAADPLFAGMARHQTCLQWHGVEVIEPPANGVVLASSPACPVQAMRVGERAWSMQYHVEVEDDTVDNWAAIPAYRESLERSLGQTALDQFRESAAQAMPGFAADAERLYRNFRAAIS